MLKKISPAEADIAFIDLQAQRASIAEEIDSAIARVLDHGQFVLGREVDNAERALSDFCGAPETITCASGTDALGLLLMAMKVGPGDAVICPAFTFAAPPEVVAWRGASIVFADVDPETFNIDPKSAAAAIALARKQGLNPVAMIAVDLYGHPADYDALTSLCDAEGVTLIGDAAQSFGATYRGRNVGTLAKATATSFFPAKPLGCYGDGGAIFTADGELTEILKSLRMHGQGTERYDHARVGLNSRLDAIQAAILVEKLRIFPDEIIARNEVATRYTAELSDVVKTPKVAADCTSVWAQYTIRLEGRDRSAFCATLKEAGVPTAIHYPRPVHHQDAYSGHLVAGGALPVSEMLASEVVSLPMHAYMHEATQERIIAAVRAALR